jgi:SAM-dependent methyltransferase
MHDSATDRTRLLSEAYATGANLAARQSIYRFREPRHDFHGWVIDHLPAECRGTVVDAGCGNGAYVARLTGVATRILALDLSIGMVREFGVAAGAQRGVADIVALPVRSASCDGAFANHMLYHVPDVAAAARELRRVLRPGGVLVAATNGTNHWGGLGALIDGGIRRAGGEVAPRPPRSFERFVGPDGASILATVFTTVEWDDVEGALVVPDALPVVDYVASMRSWLVPVLPVAWDAFLAGLHDDVTDSIARDGHVTIATHAGVFVCR